MTLPPLDVAIVAIYAVSIFALAQWVSQDYFLASRSLPWWAIGTSLIAANISAEQIIGMSGSGYAHRARHRLLRMDGGADAADRGQVLPADLPEEQDLHDAGVPEAALRPEHPAR
jgi:hypothetical protein